MVNLSDTDIEIYNKVKKGLIRSFPRNFWEGNEGYERAIRTIRYVFSDFLKWSIDEIKAKATNNIFVEYKLDRTLSHFKGSLYIALGETYPELKKWSEELYIKYDHNKEQEYRRYTDEELILALQSKARELNRVPKSEDMNNPNVVTFARRFGSWKKSLIKAGLIEDIYKNIDFEINFKERVLEHLKDICARKERMLEKEEVYQLYQEGIIKEYFGSYRRLEGAIVNDYTKADLIRILKDKAEKLGRTPNNKDMKFPRAIVFIDKFSSWQNAVDEISGK